MKLSTHWRYFAAALAGALFVLLMQFFWPHDDHEHHETSGHVPEKSEPHDNEQTHGEESHVIRLSDEQLTANGITLETAAETALDSVLRLPGQLLLNTDREARVLSPIAARVRESRVQVGERVQAGAVLAVLESQALAEVSANYLAARERRALAETTYVRAESLWQKKISAEQDYLEARKALAEARIEERSTLQKLLALGVSESDAKSLDSDSALSRYALRAPVAGTVLEKTLTTGEAVDTGRLLFHVGDLTSLWVDLAAPASALPSIKPGQRVLIRNLNEKQAGSTSGEAKILFIQPLLNTQSRSGSVRALLANPKNQWHPGMFVNAELVTGQEGLTLSVPESALQTLGGKTVIFIAGNNGLEPREIATGRRSAGRVEILSGLAAGERYAATGSFVLKAELQKSEAGHED